MYFGSSSILLATQKILSISTVLLLLSTTGFLAECLGPASSKASVIEGVLESDAWNPASTFAESHSTENYSADFDQPESDEMTTTSSLYDPVIPLGVTENLGGILMVTVALEPPLDKEAKLPEGSSIEIRVVDPRLAVCSDEAQDANLLGQSGTIRLRADAAGQDSQVHVSLPLSKKSASFMQDPRTLFSVAATVRMGWAPGDDDFQGCCKSGDFMTKIANGFSFAETQSPQYFGIPVFFVQVTAVQYAPRTS